MSNLILSLSVLSFLFSWPSFSQNRKGIDAKRFELLSGVRKGKDDKSFWDRKYSNERYLFGKLPSKFLSLNHHYLKKGSRVLDMGMGEGRNAIFLARKGHKVIGVDISSVAVKKARLLAREFKVSLDTLVASMNHYRPPKEGLDAIICFYYLDRTLHQKMISWLKPGGILIYEAHTDNQLKVKGSKYQNKKFLLREKELLSLFKGMRTLKYEEPLHLQEYTASIILQKPE